ncbi:MAG: NAD-dependent epimerase/dehydratase family protein [Thomasclavelia sp.]
MKRILITGANSYIGTSFERYMHEHHPNDYQIDTLDMIDPKWKEYDFSNYDTVFHVAGIAHADVGHVSKETKRLYYKVNCDLAYETALKAKKSDVRQFIYMSSIIIYGESAPYGKKKVITKDTKPNPANFYGDSKLQAEIKLKPLNNENFKICILRPPMIYGKGSKGNYQMLSKLAKKLPIFPDIDNERSMLYIGNLCSFVRECIDNNYGGIYFPQNEEYISTSKMVKEIARANGKNIHLTKILNPFVFILSKIPGKIGGMCNKAYGNLVYGMAMSDYDEEYCCYDLKESIKRTEGLQ